MTDSPPGASLPCSNSRVTGGRFAGTLTFPPHSPPRIAAMFKVLGGSGSDCTGATRRTFLQAGVLGVGGLALGDFLRAKASDDFAVPHVKDAAVILFWMSGGPGHMETWDPKPDAVSQFRGPFGAMKTAVPGVQFGELLPEEAKIADRLAILRGVNHG